MNNDFLLWLGALFAGALGIGTVAAVITRQDEEDDTPNTGDDPARENPNPDPPERGFELVRQTAQMFVDYAGAPDWFVDMALIQAASESGGNPLVGLGVVATFPTEYRGQPLKPNR